MALGLRPSAALLHRGNQGNCCESARTLTITLTLHMTASALVASSSFGFELDGKSVPWALAERNAAPTIGFLPAGRLITRLDSKKRRIPVVGRRLRTTLTVKAYDGHHHYHGSTPSALSLTTATSPSMRCMASSRIWHLHPDTVTAAATTAQRCWARRTSLVLLEASLAISS